MEAEASLVMAFIGSELALALRRAYNVRKLFLVDNLDIDSENEATYVPIPVRRMRPTRGGARQCMQHETEQNRYVHNVRFYSTQATLYLQLFRYSLINT